jgi:manganese/zinc/iron transport system substrate-binding protein
MRIAAFLLLLLVFLLGCEDGPADDKADRKLRVVATTGMIADLARHIGGDSVEVLALMGPGVDPHLYKATQGDLGRLRAADIVLYNGLHLEGKMGEVLEKLEQIKTVVPVSRGIGVDRLIDHPEYEGTYDPHIWFDVQLWAEALDEVLATLIEADPANRSYFERNAEAYRQELAELHKWVRQEIKKIPPERRILITAHDAFSYFGRAYDIEVRGLQGISTVSEFGLKDRVDLIDFIAGRGIKAVFVETSVSQKNIRAIVEGCRQKGHEVRIGGSLYSDAMGEAGGPAGEYTGMVRSNVNTIVNALN